MLSATLPAVSPSRSRTVTAAPARENLSAQARPIPLAAPVTRALRPVRSTLTDDCPGTMKASLMSLLHPRDLLSLTASFPIMPLKNQYRTKRPGKGSVKSILSARREGCLRRWMFQHFARGGVAGDLPERSRRQKPVTARVAFVSTPADPDSGPATRVQSRYVRAVRTEHPGMRIHLQTTLGVEERPAHVDAVERRLQEAAEKFLTPEGVRCLAAGRTVHALHGLLQSVRGEIQGLGQLFQGLRTHDLACFYDLVEASTERGFVDLRVEDLPCLPALLGHDRSCVLGVADGLAPEAPALPVEDRKSTRL